MNYKCECGKEFDNPQKFNGHKSNCDIHLIACNKLYLTKEQRSSHYKESIINKYGSLNNYSISQSEAIKNSFKSRTDTVDYYVNHINKDEFIKDYIVENHPRSFMRDKYHISDYMMDQLVKKFNCKKDKKQSSKLGWATKYSLYPQDNVNNWKKGHETRIANSGSIEASYQEGLKKHQQTMLDKYGVACSLNLDYLSNNRKKKHSTPNETFAKLLERNDINYEREYNIELKSYDFKVGSTLIEINPTITHNTYFIPYGDYSGIKETYHQDKTELAEEHGFRCLHVWDWDDVNKIISLLKPRVTVYARKCLVKEISISEAKGFLDKYHLQGYAKDQIRIGLFYDTTLVAVTTFGKPRYNKNYQYELIRYASSYNVIGGAARLFSYFNKHYSPSSIISYCDKSKFQGKVYRELGFSSKSISIGKHWYNIKTHIHITDNLLRQRGFDQLLGKEYGCYGKGTSNEELMLKHDFLPVIDAGQETFVWNSSID